MVAASKVVRTQAKIETASEIELYSDQQVKQWLKDDQLNAKTAKELKRLLI